MNDVAPSVLTTTVPILLYHAVTSTPSRWIARWSVQPQDFRAHLAVLTAEGCTPLTVSALADLRALGRPLPRRPVVVSFDDGFAETGEYAAAVMAEAGVRSTVYMTTGWIGGRSPGGDPMLSWSRLRELAAAGHEIGGHTESHADLDVIPRREAEREIHGCKRRLDDHLGVGVRSFAYPYGHHTRRLREVVACAGYDSAAAVGYAFSAGTDAPLALRRLAVGPATTVDQVRAWVSLAAAPRRSRIDPVLQPPWRALRWAGGLPRRGHAGGGR